MRLLSRVKALFAALFHPSTDRTYACLYVGPKHERYRCECGCTVFHPVKSYADNEVTVVEYSCNSCGATHEGVKSCCNKA